MTSNIPPKRTQRRKSRPLNKQNNAHREWGRESVFGISKKQIAAVETCSVL
jgi:hypothetical protein